MKALVLNALQGGDSVSAEVRQVLIAELNKGGITAEVIDLEDKNIESCSGCGYCGNKNPGMCIKKDDMPGIIKKIINSDLLTFLTPVSFGSYNSLLKKAVDRFMMLNSSLYTVYRGELHHQSRYPDTPALLTLGFLKEENREQERIFQALTERNAVNFPSPRHAALTAIWGWERERLQVEIAAGLKRMGMVS